MTGVSCSTGGEDQADLVQSAYAASSRLRGYVVLELRGEIDLAAQLEVEPHVDAITAGPEPQVVIDLRPVEFLDCSGVRLLVRARRRVGDRGGRLAVVCPESSPGYRILRRCGLLDALQPAGTLDEAVPDEGAAEVGDGGAEQR